MKSFKELGINSILENKLKERSIENPTAIQNLVIPNLLARKNIIFRSATGTGKTFAYLLPSLQLLSEENVNYQQGPVLLIIAPTFELCSQIKIEVDFLTKTHKQGLTSVQLVGSIKIDKQIETLRKNKPAIVIGNPGRVLSLAKMGKLKLNNLHFLILDEADRLTVQECIEETTELLELIGRFNQRTQLKQNSICFAACSATVSKKTGMQLGPLFKNAEIIESDDHEILTEYIEHWAIFSEKRRKDQTLRSLLSALNNAAGKKSPVKALVFTSRNDDALFILSHLLHHQTAAEGLFSKVSKKPISITARKEALDSFRNGNVNVLVSTDLAARGLDIPDITHVIALDVPSDSEFYIHRCGRTGRAGKKGIMVTIGDETQMRLLAAMEKKLKIKIYPKELHYGKITAPLPIEDDE
ncbi:MAG: DEAD/DEAH box helicase [Treponema sp.]|nr:DEAD/DEAH box helicase [Treponema sp.]MCL2250582.1 DEAD/DEAH box helicase [Treponema sp.]